MSDSFVTTHSLLKERSLLVFSVTAGMFLLAGCDLLGFRQDSSPGYPTTIESLSPERWSSLRSEFEELNDGNVCTGLDAFGFTRWDLGACLDREQHVDLKPSDSNDELVERAQAFLVKNAEFTGVKDASQLRVEHIFRPDRQGDKARRNAIIDFQHQRYEGLEVKKTLIKVMIDGSGVYMVGGHWYPDINIPEEARYNRAEAQESLVGDTISYSDWTGLKQLVITDTSFTTPADVEKVVLPIETGSLIKLHVAWKVGIRFGSQGESVGWHIFVDTMSGGRLETRQRIDF